MSNVAGSALAPGTTVAGYRIEALIGRGGMGAVYRAAEEGLGRKVALKVIAPELAQDERFRERFLRESRIAASLDHPHVIPIYQAGDEDGLLFLAMRYVEGSDLAKVVAEDGALEPKRAVDLLSQIAEALDAAHEKGLIHRDVKPSNVLIAESAGREHCYLGDFGLTKRTGSLSGVSVAGEIVGTLEYVAPEQITGNALDERADVYSLGCVLYECLTGQSPFPRATDVALLWAHVHEEPTPPCKARPDLPKELDTVLTRALAKEPGRRYRSAGELLAATRSALRLVETAPAADPAFAPESRRRSGDRAPRIGGADRVRPDARLRRALQRLAELRRRDRSWLEQARRRGARRHRPASDRHRTWRRLGHQRRGRDRHRASIPPTRRHAMRRSRWTAIRATSRWGAARSGSPSDALAELQRINPEQNEAASPTSALGDDTPCGAPRASIAFGAGSAWFVCEGGPIGQINGTDHGRDHDRRRTWCCRRAPCFRSSRMSPSASVRCGS